GVPAIVVSPAPPAAKSLPAASRPIRLGLRLVHFHWAAAKITAVQRRNGLIRLRGIRHLDEAEAASTTGLTVDHKTHPFDSPVLLEDVAQFRFCRAVRKIAYIKIFHCISSLCSASIVLTTPRLGSPSAVSRRGKGLSRNARERASATERTAEMRRQASIIPQYFGTPTTSLTGKEGGNSGNTATGGISREAD